MDGRIPGSLEGEGRFPGKPHREGYARLREQCAQQPEDWIGLVELGSGGGGIQDTQGRLFKVPLNSRGLDSSFEMTGTVLRTLM